MRLPSVSVLAIAAIAAIVSVGLPPPAGASPAASAGALRISVTAHPDLPTGPATISVRSSIELLREWSSVVTPPASVTFRDLPPGRYLVTVTGPGARAEGEVVVAVTGHVVAQARLEAAAAVSAVVVRDTALPGDGTHFSAREVDGLPAGDLWALVETAAPFAVVDRIDNGGLGAARSALAGARGASWRSTAVMVGDVRVSPPGPGGRLPVGVDLGLVDSVAATAGDAPIEMDSPGLVTAVALRRPGRQVSGRLQASWTPSGLVGENAIPGAPPVARLDAWRAARGEVGGPLGTMASGQLALSRSDVRFADRGRPELLEADATILTTQIIVDASPRDQVRVFAAGQALSHPFDGGRLFRSPDVRDQSRFWQSQITWERSRGSTHDSLSGGYQRAAWRPLLDEVEDLEGATIDRVHDGRVPAPAAATTRSTWTARVRRAWTGRPAAGGDHHVRAGASVRHVTVDRELLALPPVAETVYGLPARVWIPQAPTSPSRRRLTTVALFAADELALASDVSVQAGIRLDVTTGAAAGAARGIRWTSVSPRASFRWHPGPVALFGSAGVYHAEPSPSMLAWGDPGEPMVEVRRWRDPDGDQRFQPGEAGELVARAGGAPAVAAIDPDLRWPRTTEWTVGGEVRTGQRARLRGALVFRNESGTLGTVNVGVPASSYVVGYLPDQGEDYDGSADDRLLAVYDQQPASFGLDDRRLVNVDEADVGYEAIELDWRFASPRWFILFGAMAHRTNGWGGHFGFRVDENDQGVIGERFDVPLGQSPLKGRLFFDRAYVGKWSAGVQAGGWQLAFTVRYQDGQPFTRVVVVPNLAAGPGIVEAYAMGRTRFTYTATLDVRAARSWQVGAQRAALQFDVFNLTNHKNEVEEDVVTGPGFRRSTYVQPPISARLGFRFEF